MERPTDEALIAQLNADDWHARRRAARWLGKRQAAAAIPALISRLRDARSHVQEAAALALGDIGNPDTIPALLDSFRGDTYRFMEEDGAPHRFRRILGSAGIALARFQTPQAVEPIYDALTEAMQEYWGDDVSLYTRAESISYVGGERAYDMLMAVCSDAKFASARPHLILSLGRCGDRRALPELMKLLGSPRVHFRYEAAAALGLLGVTGAVLPLLQRLMSPEAGLEANAAPYFRHMVQINTARSLGQLNTLPALAALNLAVSLPQSMFAAAVGLAYARDTIARDILIPFAVSEDHRRVGLRAIAADALAALDDKRALDALLTFARHTRVEDHPTVEDAIDRWQGLI
jgi:HEAT repeat protein